MSDPFTEYVDQWDSLVADINKAKAALKTLTDQELSMRKALADSVEQALGDKVREGTNYYELPDGRKLKVLVEYDRKVDAAQVDITRKEYATLNDVVVPFDDLIRVKYELSKTEFVKLAPASQAFKVVSDMITTKRKTPTVTLA